MSPYTEPGHNEVDLNLRDFDLGKTAIKVIVWSAIFLGIVTSVSWLYRGIEYSRKEYQATLGGMVSIQTTASGATPQELVSTGSAWSVALTEGRNKYAPGSRRRRTFEVAAAAAGVALSGAIAETLARPEETDPVEAIMLAKTLKDIAADQAVRAIGKVNLGKAEEVLRTAGERGGRALNQLSRATTVPDLLKAGTLAATMAQISREEDRAPLLALADSLKQRASKLQELQANVKESQGEVAGSDARRKELTENIRQYLVAQGLSVTRVSAEGPLAKTLVIRGLGKSENLASLLLDSPAAKARLQEAGFIEVRTEGTNSPRSWQIGPGQQ